MPAVGQSWATQRPRARSQEVSRGTEGQAPGQPPSPAFAGTSPGSWIKSRAGETGTSVIMA